jgi:MFS family permease
VTDLVPLFVSSFCSRAKLTTLLVETVDSCKEPLICELTFSTPSSNAKIVLSLFGAGAGLGGPLGGYLNDNFGWRSAFLFQIPLLVGAFTLVSIHVNIVIPKAPLTLKQKLRRIDWLGSFTLIICVGSLLLGFSLKGTEELEWRDPWVWGLLLTSFIFLIAFIGVEAKISPEPIMPMSLLLSRTPFAVALTNL